MKGRGPTRYQFSRILLRSFVLIAIAFVRYFITDFCRFDTRKTNWSNTSKEWNESLTSIALFKSFLLGSEYLSHVNKKCISSSTAWPHAWQVLSGNGVSRYLPTSISKGRMPKRNCAKTDLWYLFKSRWR